MRIFKRASKPSPKRQIDEQTAQLIYMLLEAEDWEVARLIVEAYPQLLSNETDETFQYLIDEMRSQGNLNAVSMLEEHRALLQRCRMIGIDQAFVESNLVETTSPDAPDFSLVLEQLPTEKRRDFEDLILMADSPEQLKTALNACPDLLVALEIATFGINADNLSKTPDELFDAGDYANGLEAQYLRTGDVAILEQAVVAWQYVLDHPEFRTAPVRFRFAVANDASGIYLRRYWVLGNRTDLDNAIDLCYAAIALTRPDSPDQAIALTNLGNGLLDRYACSGTQADLQAAISVYQQAVQLTPLTSPDFALRANNSGNGLRALYVHTGNIADLEQAVAAYEQAATHVSTITPNQALILSNYGSVLLDRYAHVGTLADLNKAIALCQQAVASTPGNSPDRAYILNALADGLRKRYERAGSPSDLDQAIAAVQQSVDLAPVCSPNWFLWSTHLATLLRDRYTQIGSATDLEQAILLSQNIVKLVPADSAHNASILSNLGNALHNRYMLTGTLSDLDRSIAAWSQAVERGTENSPERALCLNNRGNGLRDRYARLGAVTDLEQAIVSWTHALELTPKESPHWSTIINNLGAGLFDRYHASGKMADLDQSINLVAQSLSVTPKDSPDRTLFFNSLGSGLYERYKRTRVLSDLEQAISYLSQALSVLSESSPKYALQLSSLGISLLEQYKRTADSTQLEQAVAKLQRAVDWTSENSTDRAVSLNNLTIGLLHQYSHLQDVDKLEQSIMASYQALELTSERSPDRPSRLNNLGNGLRARYAHTNHLPDLVQARNAYQSACELGLMIQPGIALKAGYIWGQWAFERQDWAEALEAYSYGLQAIDHLQRIQVLRAGKQSWLYEAQDLFSEMAYARARNNDPAQAVVDIEKGRARLLTEVQKRYQADLEILSLRGKAELYERYVKKSQHLAHLEQLELYRENLPSSFDLVSELQTARSDFAQICDEIRQVPGYKDFLGDLSYEGIKRLLGTKDSAGVYTLLTSLGGLALIVLKDDVRTVWLDLSDDELSALLLKYDGKDFIGGYLLAQLGATSLDSELRQVLPILGKKVMKPIAEVLKSLHVVNAWLIPCGRLALLPLHAAAYQVEGQTRYFIDDFNVSYIPSARALDHCYDALSKTSAESCTFCGVGNPLPLPGTVNELNYARPEVEEIASLYNQRPILLYEQDTTYTAVKSQLGKTTHLHLSCHGTFDMRDPLHSGIILSEGEMITLMDLMGGQRLRGTRLVVLSACQTAITDFNDLPEEAIGLPGGFVQAGVSGVVGTLWPVNDLSTMLLMVKFYEAHLKEGLAPAAALRKAQLWLRDVTNAELSELFNEYRKPPHSQTVRSIAQEQFRYCATRDPRERLYAHPYYWAAFAFYGV